MDETYTFTFTGGAFSSIAIPIRLDELYTGDPQIYNIYASTMQTQINSTTLITPSSPADRAVTSRFIQLNFGPYQGTVSFNLRYAIDGVLQSGNNENILRWSTRWPVSVCLHSRVLKSHFH